MPESSITESVDGDTTVATSQSGEPVAMTKDNGSARFSISTYEDDGREYLTNWLEKKVKSGGVTREDADDIVKQMDEYYDLCKTFEDKYAPFGAWSKAKVVKDKALRNEAEALVDCMYRAQGLQNAQKSGTLTTENNERGGRHSVDREAEGVQTRTSGRRLGRGGSGVHGIGYAHVQTVAEHGREGQQKDISNDELKRAAVTPDDSSGAKRARDICVSYGVSTYVVPDSLMQAAVDNIGFAQSGEV